MYATYCLFLNKTNVSMVTCCPRDDPEGSFSDTKLVLQELDIPHFTMDDCRHVQHVCWQVSQRAAYLAATGVYSNVTIPEPSTWPLQVCRVMLQSLSRLTGCYRCVE